MRDPLPDPAPEPTAATPEPTATPDTAAAPDATAATPDAAAAITEPLAPPIDAPIADPAAPPTTTPAPATTPATTSPYKSRRLHLLAGIRWLAARAFAIALFVGGVAIGYSLYVAVQPPPIVALDPAVDGAVAPAVVQEFIAALASNDAAALRSAVPADPYQLLIAEMSRWDFQTVQSVETLSTYVDGPRTATELVMTGLSTEGIPVSVNLRRPRGRRPDRELPMNPIRGFFSHLGFIWEKNRGRLFILLGIVTLLVFLNGARSVVEIDDRAHRQRPGAALQHRLRDDLHRRVLRVHVLVPVPAAEVRHDAGRRPDRSHLRQVPRPARPPRACQEHGPDPLG